MLGRGLQRGCQNTLEDFYSSRVKDAEAARDAQSTSKFSRTTVSTHSVNNGSQVTECVETVVLENFDVLWASLVARTKKDEVCQGVTQKSAIMDWDTLQTVLNAVGFFPNRDKAWRRLGLCPLESVTFSLEHFERRWEKAQ